MRASYRSFTCAPGIKSFTIQYNIGMKSLTGSRPIGAMPGDNPVYETGSITNELKVGLPPQQTTVY